MRDLHACRLECKDAGFRVEGVGRQVDENIEIIGGDALCRFACRHLRDHLEMIAKPAEALGPRVARRRQRIKENLEAIAVVTLHRRPHHFAHHVVAQVAGKIADANAAGAARLRQGQRRAVDAGRDGVVDLIETQLRLLLDVEEEQQVQQFLQAIGQLGFASGFESILLQPLEVAIQRGVVGAVLAGFERLDGQRQRVRTHRFEAIEGLEPGPETARAEQRFGQRLVGGHVARIAREHGFERLDRCVDRALLAEDHADVEVGGEQLRIQRQRALVRAQRLTALMQQLQGHAAVVMRRGISGVDLERVLEGLVRGGAIVLREPRHPERAPQRDVVGRERDALLAKLGGLARKTVLALQIRERRAGLDVRGRSGKRGTEGDRGVAPLAAVAQQHAEQMLRRCITWLLGEQFPIPGDSRLDIAGLMRGHNPAPERGEFGRRMRGDVGKPRLGSAGVEQCRLERKPVLRERLLAATPGRGQGMRDQRRDVAAGEGRIRPRGTRRSLREQRSERGVHTHQVDHRVGVGRTQHARHLRQGRRPKSHQRQLRGQQRPQLAQRRVADDIHRGGQALARVLRNHRA